MSASNLPLDGVRVLDLGIITAGAASSAILADLGADVIKIEAPNYIDPFRIWVDFDKKDDWWNHSPHFNFTNRNKRSVCLDLKSSAGHELFLKLVTMSDVLVENFRRGVMDRLGLSIQALHKANPKLIVAAISSQGETGPERDVSSFGSTLEATSGLASLAGAPGEAPVLTGRDLNYPDQVVALFAAGMIVAALSARKKTGVGTHLDISQRELTSFLIGERFMSDCSMSDREGNGDLCTPGQCVARADDGAWIALTRTVPIGAGATINERSNDEAALRQWIGKLPANDAICTLRRDGVAASVVLDGQAIREAEWFSHTEAFASTPNSTLVKGFAFQYRETPMRIVRETPNLGQDNVPVLCDLLKVSADDVIMLSKDGVIGQAPIK